MYTRDVQNMVNNYINGQIGIHRQTKKNKNMY